MPTPEHELLDRLVGRCTFPDTAEPVRVAFSGGPDSSALLALARHAGLSVTAVHVDHGLRIDSADDVAIAERIARRLGADFHSRRVDVADGPDLEARGRTARLAVTGRDAMTGHTADDQAETVLLALLRGSGATGLAAMRPGPTHPILSLRRSDTHAVCDALDLVVVDDPTNRSTRFRRNRVRHDLLPLLDAIAERDLVPLLERTAGHLRDDDDLLDLLAADLDPTDARALRDAPAPLARRALRRWLTVDGHPPDAAAIERVLAVARCEVEACEIAGGRRIARSAGRLAVS